MVDFTRQHYDSFTMPVSGVAVDYPSGHIVEPHSHPCVQLIYAIEGVLVIESPTGRWVTPPSRGVWLQAGVEHSLRMRGAARVRSLFVHSDIIDGMPQGNCVIDVSPLLRELILAATEIEAPYESDSRDGRVMRLLLDELCVLPTLPLYLPWPDDDRIAHVCRSLTEQPQLSSTAQHWAQQLAMSPKTFHRRFKHCTGVTFGRWRQQARLLLSLEFLAQGMPIMEVALQHGYDSQSAFSAAFKRQFGVAPSAFYQALAPIS
ncbi:AraC family transcriptional regulator [Oceanisphaera sp. KMM 10153]|uniref:AraC family transcriptional regulator n=1 Tax=Oceanisphaera submarina TaxID=3390193 RepID=UPI003974B409